MLQRRHAELLLALAEQGDRAETDADAWLAQVEARHEDIQTSLRWAIHRGDAYTALQLGAGLCRFWVLSGRADAGLEWLKQALALEAEDVPADVRVHGLNAAATLATERGDLQQATTYLRQTFDLLLELGHRPQAAQVMESLGDGLRKRRDAKGAENAYREALAMRRDLVDKPGTAALLEKLGDLLRDRDDLVTAHAYYGESLQLRRELNDKLGLASVLNSMAYLAEVQEDWPTARAACEESLALERELADDRGIATALVNLSIILAREGEDYGRAVELATDGLDIFAHLDAREEIAACMEAMGEVASIQGKALESARFYGTAERLRLTLGIRGAPLRATSQFHISKLLSGQDPARIAQYWSEGRVIADQLAEAYGWGDEPE